MTMTSWTELVIDAAPIKAIFGEMPPTLEGINLHEIVLHRDGPRVSLRFDFPDFPEHPPKKWSAAGFNRVQVCLLALGVKELQIAGLQSNIQMNLSMHKDGSMVRLYADNGEFRFDLGTESVIVDSISAYREGSW